MMKAKKYDWKDSNMALVGSDEDRSVKKESAMSEPAWQKVLKCNGPGLFVWRIEKFKVVEWPKEEYGKFFSGDSYIILNIYKNPDSQELLYDVHFWIGKESTQDEYGTAAYKTVEVDNLLDDKPVQHREVQGHESELFKSYFSSLLYMKGGCDTGFRHVETREYQPRLLHIRSDTKRVVVQEVKKSKKCLDSGDVFILDLGTKVIQWNGVTSNKNERFKAVQFLNELKESRLGKVEVEVIEDTDMDCPLFYESLTDEDTKKSFKEQKNHKHEKIVSRLSDDTGTLDFSEVGRGDFNRSNLTEDDVFIIDNGETVYVYIGENASSAERSNAFAYAHNYLKETEYPYLNVTVVNNKVTGPTKSIFEKAINSN